MVLMFSCFAMIVTAMISYPLLVTISEVSASGKTMRLIQRNSRTSFCITLVLNVITLYWIVQTRRHIHIVWENRSVITWQHEGLLFLSICLLSSAAVGFMSLMFNWVAAYYQSQKQLGTSQRQKAVKRFSVLSSWLLVIVSWLFTFGIRL